MSRHRRTTSSAQWNCRICRLSTEPSFGPSAADETAHLAAIHDRLHHGGARTAELLFIDEIPALYAAAS